MPRSRRRRTPAATGRLVVEAWRTNNGREYALRRGRVGEIASLHVSDPVLGGVRSVTFHVAAPGEDYGLAIGRMSPQGDVTWRDFERTRRTVEEHGALFDQLLELHYQLRDRPDGEYTVEL